VIIYVKNVLKEVIELDKLVFGKFLRNKRESKKLGMREMSRAINISPSYLSDIEHGRTNPSLETLRIIVDFLKLTQGEKAAILSDINVNPTMPSAKMRPPGTRARKRKTVKKIANS
jgi:transcriptional regulator with XRE-family HTH domain